MCLFLIQIQDQTNLQLKQKFSFATFLKNAFKNNFLKYDFNLGSLVAMTIAILSDHNERIRGGGGGVMLSKLHGLETKANARIA